MKLTPLNALHHELGAKLVEFAGWEMPVSYPAGVLAEHRAAREGAALFDVSHMCQAELRGPGAARALEALVPSAIDGLPEGKARYTFFTNSAGGILDDLIVTNAGDHLFLVLNAARREHDLAHLRGGLTPDIEVVERTDLALIALQGPGAEAMLAPLAPVAADLRFMQSAPAMIDGHPARISRLGYSGEDGFEISIAAEAADPLARRLLEAGAEAAGLGARDSLRMEAGLPLYGNDLDATTSPVEAGLAWAIPKRRREAADFPGARRILRELDQGPVRRLTGIQPESRAPARAGTEIQCFIATTIGMVTSGGFGPTVDGPISMGYINSQHADAGVPLTLMIRGKPHPARIHPLPFVPHRYKR